MAYLTATVVQKDPPLADGRTHLVVQFTGDAGETPRNLDRYLDGESTALGERAWVRDELGRLNGRKSIADSVSVGQIVTPAAAPAAPTQAEVDRRAWVEKAQRLARCRAMGTLANGTLATAITALQTDVQNSYQAGWIADV